MFEELDKWRGALDEQPWECCAVYMMRIAHDELDLPFSAEFDINTELDYFICKR